MRKCARLAFLSVGSPSICVPEHICNDGSAHARTIHATFLTSPRRFAPYKRPRRISRFRARPSPYDHAQRPTQMTTTLSLAARAATIALATPCAPLRVSRPSGRSRLPVKIPDPAIRATSNDRETLMKLTLEPSPIQCPGSSSLPLVSFIFNVACNVVRKEFIAPQRLSGSHVVPLPKKYLA